MIFSINNTRLCKILNKIIYDYKINFEVRGGEIIS